MGCINNYYHTKINVSFIDNLLYKMDYREKINDKINMVFTLNYYVQ